MKGIALVLAFVVGSTSPTAPSEPVEDRPEETAPVENVDASASPSKPAESIETKPTPTDRGCVREDFADFDDFVACRVEREATSTPPPAVEQPAAAPDPEQAEIAEIRANRKTARERSVAEDVREEMLFRRVGIGLVVPGALASITGLVLIIAGTAGGGSASRKMCMVGKPCGDTCIEVADTCHIGGSQDDGDDGGDMNPVLIGVGAAVAVVGVGLLIGSIVAFRRSKDAAYNARTRGLVRLNVDAGGLRVHF